MELTGDNRAALEEMINIGYGRAAAALSELTGQRIVLEAPKIEIHPVDLIKDALRGLLEGEVSSVHQVFSGAVSGHALLLVDSMAAQALTALVVDDALDLENRRAVRREALTEVGNIVLQASMGVCGDLLQVHVGFAAPRLHIETIDDLLNSLMIEKQELQFALLIRTRFQLFKSQVSGYLLVILSITSFSRLLAELEKWHRRQTAV